MSGAMKRDFNPRKAIDVGMLGVAESHARVCWGWAKYFNYQFYPLYRYQCI